MQKPLQIALVAFTVVRQTFFFKFLAALLLGLLVVFVLDPFEPTTIHSPLCLGTVLAILSIRQSTLLVVAVSVVYAFLVLYALFASHQYHAAHLQGGLHPFFGIFQRMSTFMVLCCLAIHTAYYREGSQQMIGQLMEVLAELPVPVILSNNAAQIIYANKEFFLLLNKSPAKNLYVKNFEASYVEIIRMGQTIGSSGSKYYQVFDSGAQSFLDVEVGPPDNLKRMKATLVAFGAGSNRLLITILSK